MTPGGVCGGAPFYQSPVDQKPPPCDVVPPASPMDPHHAQLMDPHHHAHAQLDEPRLTFLVRDAPIMPPFRLEHNFSVSKFIFVLSNHDYSQVISR